MNSPLKFNVAPLLRGAEADGMPQQRRQAGPAPERIGVEMIAVPAGDEIVVDATLTPLGSGIMVDAEISGELIGECARCLAELRRPLELRVSQVFAVDEDFITGDEPAEEDAGSGDEVPQIHGDTLDLLQSTIDEVGLTLPFAPTCETECTAQTPDNVTVSSSEDSVDPRWSGLEKFL